MHELACSNSFGRRSVNLNEELPSRNGAYPFSFCCRYTGNFRSA